MLLLYRPDPFLAQAASLGNVHLKRPGRLAVAPGVRCIPIAHEERGPDASKRFELDVVVDLLAVPYGDGLPVLLGVSVVYARCAAHVR